MNRTAIEYAQYHWPLVTGCDHGPAECATSATCWARTMAHRFHRDFTPTLHPELLHAPTPRTPSRILVSFGGDMFSDWWWDEPERRGAWDYVVEEAKEVMVAHPQHSYLWLTKRPVNYGHFHWPSNAWLGASITGAESREQQGQRVGALCGVNSGRHPAIWVSYEPMLGPLTVWLGGISWLVIGAQGGPGAKRPERAWVDAALKEADRLGIPVWVKRNVRAVFPDLPVREELPRGMVQ